MNYRSILIELMMCIGFAIAVSCIPGSPFSF